MAYNLLNCQGWEVDSVAKYLGSAPCIKSRFGIIILFFLIAIIRRWGGEEMGIDFSFLLALIGGLGGYLVLITIFGSLKIAFGFGLVIALLLGYVGGTFFGGGEDY